MKTQIVEKLNRFLNEHTPINEEFEVVYLMVELRKLLDIERDQNNKDSYTLVRFHADWTVHTRKDNITEVMKEILGKIDDSLNPLPKNGNINFLLLPEFRKEIAGLFEEYNLPDKFCKKDTE